MLAFAEMGLPNLQDLEELIPRIVKVMLTHPDVPNSFGESGPVIWLKDYPSGSCDITSLTIATMLHERGLGGISCRRSMRMDKVTRGCVIAPLDKLLCQ